VLAVELYVHRAARIFDYDFDALGLQYVFVSITVDHQNVVLCEIALEDTQKALAYLKVERTFAWRKQNAITLPR
jgi:hypothetical protein